MNIFRIFSSKQATSPSPILREIKPGPTKMGMLIQEINSSHTLTQVRALSQLSRQVGFDNTLPKDIVDVVPVLVKMLSEEPTDQHVCEYAAKILGIIREKGGKEIVLTATVLPILTNVIERKDKFSPIARSEALIAVGYFGKEAKDIIPLIISLLGDRDEDSYADISAACALKEIAKEAKEEVKQALINALNNSNDHLRGSAAASLGIIFKKEAKDALEILVNGLHDKSAHVRRSCALTLGYMGKEAESATLDLVKLLADKSENVTETSKWALTEIAKEL